MNIDKRKLLLLLIGLAACIITIVIVMKVAPSETVPTPDRVSNSIDRHRHRAATDSTATGPTAEELINDIERSIHAEDGWSGKTYGLLLNIKQLDDMREQLTPEQLQLLESYKAQYPDWEEIDE